MLPVEDKDQASKVYLYLKYLNHFVYHAINRTGFPSKEPTEKLDPALDEMIEIMLEQLAETSFDVATNIYHGKIVKLKDAIQLVTQEKDLSLELPEQVIPFNVARNIIIRNGKSIAVGECPCRAASAEHCTPLDVCLFIGDPFASFIAEQQPTKFRKISQEEAVSILEAEHKRGHVHTAYFKRETGNGFYAICNCCSCCCLNVRMWNLLGGQIPSLAPSGYTSTVNDQCTGCSVCVDTCPFKAISLNEDEQKAIADVTKCMGCGVCEDVCAVDALKLERNSSKGEPLDIEELMKVRK
jgi:ferredoxin